MAKLEPNYEDDQILYAEDLNEIVKAINEIDEENNWDDLPEA